MAPQPFINRLLGGLKARMRRIGDTLITQGEPVDQVYFFNNGSGMLTKEFESPVYGTTQLEVAVLPEGSFFGELPGLLGIAPVFGL